MLTACALGNGRNISTVKIAGAVAFTLVNLFEQKRGDGGELLPFRNVFARLNLDANRAVYVSCDSSVVDRPAQLDTQVLHASNLLQILKVIERRKVSHLHPFRPDKQAPLEP